MGMEQYGPFVVFKPAEVGQRVVVRWHGDSAEESHSQKPYNYTAEVIKARQNGFFEVIYDVDGKHGIYHNHVSCVWPTYN